MKRAERGSLKPPLKWAGGKRWLLPYLRPIWQTHKKRRLVEPLCGGLAVSFGLMPRQALLNDANPYVINFYRWVKQGLEITIPMRNESKMFYEHRGRFNSLVTSGHADSKEAAELFYYLNQTAFNGLCRLNRRGEFNVPFGRRERINYRRSFEEHKEAVKDWDFTIGDFGDVLVKAGDLVYADPPYHVGFNHYSSNGFPWEDQIRLAKWLTGHEGPVILSNHATERIVELYRAMDFSLHYVDGPRRISCTGDRTAVREVIATKEIKWGADLVHPLPLEMD